MKVVPITGNYTEELDYLWENISQCRSIKDLKVQRTKTFVGLTLRRKYRFLPGYRAMCLSCDKRQGKEFADLQIDGLSNDSLCYDEEKNILFLKEIKQPSDFIADSDLYYGWDLD